MKVLYLEQLPK